MTRVGKRTEAFATFRFFYRLGKTGVWELMNGRPYGQRHRLPKLGNTETGVTRQNCALHSTSPAHRQRRQGEAQCACMQCTKPCEMQLGSHSPTLDSSPALGHNRLHPKSPIESKTPAQRAPVKRIWILHPQRRSNIAYSSPSQSQHKQKSPLYKLTPLTEL